jgi:hypothetical protein
MVNLAQATGEQTNQAGTPKLVGLSHTLASSLNSRRTLTVYLGKKLKENKKNNTLGAD